MANGKIRDVCLRFRDQDLNDFRKSEPETEKTELETLVLQKNEPETRKSCVLIRLTLDLIYLINNF